MDETHPDFYEECQRRSDEGRRIANGLPPSVEFTEEMIEAIYAAWHGAGVDIAGGNWDRFVGMLPRA
jgi:hypothetical protein